MFGSQILDTAIGVVFIFVLVSTLVTIGNELVASILGSRAAWLAVGVERLLGATLAAELYAHPLIGGAQDDPPASGRWWRKGSERPSYIASRTFANVLLDVVHQKSTLLQSARGELEKLCAIPDPGAPASDVASFRAAARATAAALAQAGCPAVAESLNRLMLQLPAAASREDARAAVLNFSATLAANGLQDAIGDLRDTRVGKVLVVLLRDAEGDLDKFKENVEVWFNNAMDRVAGWYKRRSQWVVFALGLAIAVVMNVDTLAIVHALQTSPGARDALVAQAKAYADDKTVAASMAAPPASGVPIGALPPQAEAIQSRLLQLDLPIAWVRGTTASAADRSLFDVIPESADAGWDTLRFHALGWLITALAATLGAPFWFDMLNRIVAVRSTGKAPEEKPKPPKQVQLPLQPGESPKEAEQAAGAQAQ